MEETGNVVGTISRNQTVVVTNNKSIDLGNTGSFASGGTDGKGESGN